VRMRLDRGYRTLAVAAAALVVAGTAVAVAGAAHGKAHRQHVVRALVQAGVHSDVNIVRADGSTESFSLDRGRVTASSPTSVTLQRPDGKSVTLAIVATTKIHGTLGVGRPVLVVSQNGTALRVRAPRPFTPLGTPAVPAAKKAKIVHVDVTTIRANGKVVETTLDRGQVTNSSSSSLTLKREDGTSVTFSVNAQTKIRGKLAVGGKAAVVSRAAVAVRVLARAHA